MSENQEVCSLKMAKLLHRYKVKNNGRYMWLVDQFGKFNIEYNNEINSIFSLKMEKYPALTTLELIKLLPKKTYNGESFGLAIQVCNKNEWCVFYYTHYSKKHNPSFPTVVGKTIPEALCKMYLQMKGYEEKKRTKGHPVAE